LIPEESVGVVNPQPTEGNVVILSPSRRGRPRKDSVRRRRARSKPDVSVELAKVKQPKSNVGRKIYETDEQLAAFNYYLSLGPERSVERVATHLGVPARTVKYWAQTRKWTERVREYESKSKEERFKERAIELLNLFLETFTQVEDGGRLTLVANDKATIEKFKLCIEAFKRLRDDTREEKSAERDDGGGGNGKNQVMVNVVIKK